MDRIVQSTEGQRKSLFHAYLFVGSDTEQTKLQIGQIIRDAQAWREDIFEIFGSDNKGKAGELKIDDVRGLIHDLSLSPAGPVRIGVIHDAERLNVSSANILLKILEEPPAKVILILVSKTVNLPATVKSRCRIIKTSAGLRSENHTFSYSNILTSDLAVVFKQVENIVKDQGTENFLDELEKYLEQKMLVSKNEKIANLLAEVVRADRKIKQNANARLILENIILKVRAI